MNEVDISEQELLEKYPAVLHALLKDHTRTDCEKERALREGRKVDEDFQRNIIWGTDNYQDLGELGFGEQDEITEEKITGENRWLVRPRAVKDREIQRQRVKDMAEVFTPSWVCNAQNNLIDEAWFGRADVFNTEFVDKEGVHRWTPTEGKIVFDEEPSRTSTKSWKDYVKDVRLEISWNLWQMDGLKMVLPYSCHEETEAQMDFFAEAKSRECPACTKGELTGHNGIKCVIRDWTKKRDQQKIEFEKILTQSHRVTETRGFKHGRE